MSNISSYPIITPKGGDLVVGSETYDANEANPVKGNPTRNFSVSSVVSTQIPNYITGTINKIPVFTASNKIQDSIMTETAAGGSFTGKYISISAAGGGLSTQKLEVNKALIDGAGSTGTDGFVLSSATVGGDKEVAWINTSSFLTGYLPLTGGTMSGTVLFNDNAKAKFGTGSDLEIYHNGSNSYIDDIGTGDLYIRANNLRLANADGTGQFINANNGGGVDLYHNNVKKLEITSSGVTISGNASLAGDIYLPANKGIYFGGNNTSAYELDYYQEGEFTPSASGWNADPNEITGMYTRVGNKVTINVKWKGGGMDNVGDGFLQGLPFAPKQGAEATELFTGSVMGDNYNAYGIAAVKYNTNAANSRIYFSAQTFTATDQKYFVTITYLVDTV